MPPAQTGDTAVQVATCAELAPVGVMLEPDVDGPDTQIHATSAFDGAGVWVVWNRPDASGNFDVWVARLSCEGTVDVGPIEVTDSGDNEIDPTVAVSGDRVLVAWQSDNGGSSDNLDIRWRVLGLDGETVGGVHELDSPGNQWMPSATASSDGFVLAGSGGGGQVFEVFSQVLDLDGEPLGGPLDMPGDPGGGEFWPSVAVDPAGVVHLTWEGDSMGYSADGTVSGWPVVASQPSVSAAGDQAWVGWADGLGSVFVAKPGSDPVELKGGDKTHFSIGLAAGEDGGHAAWFTNVSGLDNKLKIGRFDSDGVLLDSVDVGTETAPPYPVQLTRISADVVFLAWQDGENPDYRVKGGFFEL